MNYDEDYYNDYDRDYDDYDSDDCGFNSNCEPGWETNWGEETWYALTDGEYGDYPGGDVDYDGLGF